MLEERSEDTNQQLKKWILRWQPVVDHSMKRVKELAKENSRPIWRHFTADKTSKVQSIEEESIIQTTQNTNNNVK